MSIGCKLSVLPSAPFGCECETDSYIAVQDGDISQVQFGLLAVTSANIISVGDFASSTGWTVGAGWTIGGGVATFATTPSTLSRTTDYVLTPGYYVIKIKIDAISTATSLQFKLGGTSFSIITAFPEVNTIYLYKYISSISNQLLEILGAAPSGAISINDISVQRMSELSFDINNCDDDSLIVHRDYADNDIEYIETGNIDTDDKYHIAHAQSTFVTFVAGIEIRIPSSQAQITIDWQSLGISYGCFYICFKDEGLINYEWIRNGDVHNTDFWTITNTGAFGWAITTPALIHTPTGTAGDDVAKQDLDVPLGDETCHQLSFTVDRVSGAGGATLRVLYDTATLTDQVLDSTLYSSFPTVKTIGFSGIAITKLKFVCSESGAAVISVDNISLKINNADDCVPCVCQTMCISFKETHDDTFPDVCNMLIKASNDNNGLGFDFTDFTFEQQFRIFGKLRHPKYDYTDELYHKDSNGLKKIVSTGYDKYSELQVYQIAEGMLDILSVLIVHQSFSITIDGTEQFFVKRPGSMSPTWSKTTGDAPVIIELSARNQDRYNYLGS